MLLVSGEGLLHACISSNNNNNNNNNNNENFIPELTNFALAVFKVVARGS